MKHVRTFFCASLFFVVCLAVAAIAQAQAPGTWVAGEGDDANPCARTNPCRTFAGALSKTATGGQIRVLSSGDFGAVTITKSITIDGTSSLAISGGITINITDANDAAKSVRLRGLVLNGAGTAAFGINVISGNNLSVEDTVIDGFQKSGINVTAGIAFARNTTVRNILDAGVSASSGGQLALAEVALIFNGKGMGGQVKGVGNVYLYGNRSGDPNKGND